MRFTLALFLFFGSLCSCSNQRENTYEESLATCTKKLGHFPKGIDTTSLKGAEAKIQFQEQIRECMKGSMGPIFRVKIYRGDSVNTYPARGKAMVLFFWFISPNAPIKFRTSDSVSFVAMNALYRRYKHNVDFLGFPFNDSLTTQQYLREHPLDFPQAHDKKINEKYDVLTQNISPYIIFINTQGRVTKICAGSLTRNSLIIERYSPIIQACIENKPYTD